MLYLGIGVDWWLHAILSSTLCCTGYILIIKCAQWGRRYEFRHYCLSRSDQKQGFQS